MDRHQRLEAMNSGKSAQSTSYECPIAPPIKGPAKQRSNIYEGSDSDEEPSYQCPPAPKKLAKQRVNIYEGSDSDEEETMMGQGQGKLDPKTGEVVYGGGNLVDTTDVNDTKDLKRGQFLPEGTRFMSMKFASQYPYMFIGHSNRQKVVTNFFDKGQIHGHTFDLFYLYEDHNGVHPSPLVLILSKQFERLLKGINLKLGINLSIPKGAAGDNFYIGFHQDGNPQPRYIGRSSSQQDYEKLTFAFPPYDYTDPGQAGIFDPPTPQAVTEFQEKIRQMKAKSEGSKAANKEKKQRDQAQRVTDWASEFKLVQRLLGIRPSYDDTSTFASASSSWDISEAMTKLALEDLFDPSEPAKYKPRDRVVFIAVDVEAWEKNSKTITEIGIATLDTWDLVDQASDDNGAAWAKNIRARHFRIRENMHCVNRQFVAGCEENFDFGQSEFINLDDGAAAIVACFEQPFSLDPSKRKDFKHFETERKVILVGHNITADIAYLKTVNVDVTRIPAITNTVDTDSMWKHITRSTNSTSLSKILYDLGMEAWYAHNAGNDAVYTLQAMLGMIVKHTLKEQEPERLALKKDFNHGTVVSKDTSSQAVSEGAQRLQPSVTGDFEDDNAGGSWGDSWGHIKYDVPDPATRSSTPETVIR